MATMLQGMTQLGGGAFNHHSSADTEREYDRLRDLARQEAGKRSHCLSQSQQAYQRGDGGAAHNLSEEGKRHGLMMEQYNKQASDFIFRENNAADRVAGDTIDLHGQFVEEAEDILEQRIRAAKQRGEGHLHVIVGKGNHSPGHVQKIKPRVEQVCRELGLQYATEENAGRIYVNLQGGEAVMPGHLAGGGYSQGYGGKPYGGGQYHGGGGGGGQGQGQGPYPGQQQHSQHQQYGGGQGAQQNDQNAEIEAQVKKYLPKVLRQIKKSCCTVM